MINVPAAGVILTSNYASMKNIFGKGSSKSIARALEKDDEIFRFNNAGTTNLLNFHAKWGSSEKNAYFTVEIIDPTKDFEDRFMKLNLPSLLVNSFFSFQGSKLPTEPLPGFEDIVGAPERKDLDESRIAKFQDIISQLYKIEKLEKFINGLSKEDFRHDLFSRELRSRKKTLGEFGNVTGFNQDLNTGEITLNYANSTTWRHPSYGDTISSFKALIERDAEWKKQNLEAWKVRQGKNDDIIRSNKKAEEYNELPKDQLISGAIAKFLKEGVSTNLFYLAFGSGDNLDQWAGPFSVKLIDANMIIDGNKARVLTLGFAFADGLLPLSVYSDQNPLYLDLQGYGMKAEGRSDFITLNDSFIRETQIQVLEALNKNGPRVENLLPTISSLVKKIDIHNIVLQCVRTYLMSVCKTQNVIVLLPDINNSHIKQYLELFNSLVSQHVEFSKSEDILGVVRIKRGFGGIPIGFQTPDAGLGIFTLFRGGGFTGFDLPIEKQRVLKVTKFSAAIESFISTILSKYGLGIEKERVKSLTKGPIHQKNIEGPSQAGAPFRAVMTSDYREHIDKFWHSGKKEFIDSGIPNYATPLNSVINQISKGDDQEDLDVMYWEGNLDIVEVWSKHIPDAIADKTKPVVIFGSRKLIELFIYGRYRDLINPEDKTDPRNNYSRLLHPDDNKMFNINQMYTDLKKVIFGEDKRFLQTPLGDFFSLPSNDDIDELALRKTQESIIKDNYPVFRSNTQNPNVLELDINYDGSYLAAMMQTAFETSFQFYPTLSDSSTEDIEKKYAKNHNWYKLIKDMRTNHITEKDAIGYLKKELKSTVADDKTITELVALIFSMNLLDPTRLRIPVYNENGASPISIQAQLLRKLIPKGLSIEVKTLPFFSISSAYFFYRVCYLIGHQPQIIGSIPIKSDVDTFYSGAYLISQWEHRISKDDVSSSFTLVKDIDLLTNEELNVTDKSVKYGAVK